VCGWAVTVNCIRLIDSLGFVLCGWAVNVNNIRLIDCLGFCCVLLSCYCEQYKVNWLHVPFVVCGWAVIVNSIRLIDCMGFCCVWLTCYCEQYKVKTNFQGIGCTRWLDCCRTGQGQVVELLWMRQWMFRFHKMGGIPWVAEELLASQRELCNYSEGSVCRTYSCTDAVTFVNLCLLPRFEH